MLALELPQTFHSSQYAARNAPREETQPSTNNRTSFSLVRLLARHGTVMGSSTAKCGTVTSLMPRTRSWTTLFGNRAHGHSKDSLRSALFNRSCVACLVVERCLMQLLLAFCGQPQGQQSMTNPSRQVFYFFALPHQCVRGKSG